MRYKIADSNDIETIMAIRLEMLRIVNHLPADHVFPASFVASSRAYFVDGDQTTILALDGDQAIGCATLSYLHVMPTFDHPTGHRGHLMNVYTNANYRRLGIGRKMVELLIDEAKRHGVTEISLDATESGRPLYEALGFAASEECMVKKLL